MKKQPLRVGFDLDGVLLYNPARIIRPIVALYKNTFLHKKDLAFYYPYSSFAQWMWKQFHKSSIFIAPGMNIIESLVKQNKIEAYLITARYSFLGPELLKWVNKHGFKRIFSGIYYNSKNEQPHLYKEKMINKFSLNIFVEDNWDIVNYLSKDNKVKCNIFWIYNIFDRGIQYSYKFPYLIKAVQFIKNEAE
ncbi:hypothetical protein COY87_00310 [Candidatus Roizmanbacteria bacterium CG_4_10_14_0_8_um_filter_33_9]|uniref:FCP1 homology domain-containing protein n=1 Tax=Candidatus Roizmanbacteria bacterium CG_4_10_14_0_8_um_filter_33_9 TaxID=1974826 RepID=A0A2M7QJR6_9BACT|nr:MAG: hypothetical protein COY87_00310 [Candidatus Roizmanbacteria bacterium CG_4_10_14_0_8_um_filter_33_9]